jgi:uncharacterized protein (DUF433 family)
MTDSDSLRFSLPLYTVAEAARIVDVPPSTFVTWARGYVRRPAGRAEVVGDPIISYVTPEGPGEPSIPFVGLAEGLVLAAIRKSGVPMQRVRPAITALEEEIGLAHALASRRLYSDGAEVLFDYAVQHAESSEGKAARNLVVVRSGQRVFTEVIEAYLRRIEYAEDGYAAVIHLPAYRSAEVVADPKRSFGAPVLERGGARVEDVLERFWAGESLSEVAREFGAPEEQLEDLVRVASQRAA